MDKKTIIDRISEYIDESFALEFPSPRNTKLRSLFRNKINKWKRGALTKEEEGSHFPPFEKTTPEQLHSAVSMLLVYVFLGVTDSSIKITPEEKAIFEKSFLTKYIQEFQIENGIAQKLEGKPRSNIGQH